MDYLTINTTHGAPMNSKERMERIIRFREGKSSQSSIQYKYHEGFDQAPDKKRPLTPTKPLLCPTKPLQ